MRNLGMRLRSDEILIGTTRGVIKTRTLRRRVEEEQWDNEFARSIKGEPRQAVLGINSDHVPAAFPDRAAVPLEEDQADARLGQQDEGIGSTGSTRSFDASRQTYYPSTFRYIEENVRHEKFGQEVWSNTTLAGSLHFDLISCVAVAQYGFLLLCAAFFFVAPLLACFFFFIKKVFLTFLLCGICRLPRGSAPACTVPACSRWLLSS